jgi:hypothetical protein
LKDQPQNIVIAGELAVATDFDDLVSTWRILGSEKTRVDDMMGLAPTKDQAWGSARKNCGKHKLSRCD